jgi:hypothetical protein
MYERRFVHFPCLNTKQEGGDSRTDALENALESVKMAGNRGTKGRWTRMSQAERANCTGEAGRGFPA